MICGEKDKEEFENAPYCHICESGICLFVQVLDLFECLLKLLILLLNYLVDVLVMHIALLDLIDCPRTQAASASSCLATVITAWRGSLSPDQTMVWMSLFISVCLIYIYVYKHIYIYIYINYSVCIYF